MPISCYICLSGSRSAVRQRGKFWRIAARAVCDRRRIIFFDRVAAILRPVARQLSLRFLPECDWQSGGCAGFTNARLAACRFSSLPEGGSAVFARALLFAWVAWRLYPYVPTIDLHKYWNSLKPIVLYPEIGAYNVLLICSPLDGRLPPAPRTGVQPKMPAYAVGGYDGRLFLRESPDCKSVSQPLRNGRRDYCPVFSSACQARAIILRGLALLFAVVVVLSRILPWHSAIDDPAVPMGSLLQLAPRLLDGRHRRLFRKDLSLRHIALLLVEAGDAFGLCLSGGMRRAPCNQRLANTDCRPVSGNHRFLIALLLALVYLMLDRQQPGRDVAASRKRHVSASGLQETDINAGRNICCSRRLILDDLQTARITHVARKTATRSGFAASSFSRKPSNIHISQRARLLSNCPR